MGSAAVNRQESTALIIDVLPYDRWAEVKPHWSELVQQVPHASAFLTETWVSAWLDVFGTALRPRILQFRRGAELIGACLIVRTIERRSVVPVSVVHLNTAGEGEHSPCIEYNGLLALDGCQVEVASALREFLSREKWDELALSGIAGGEWTDALRAGATVRRRARPSYFVDLARLRVSGNDYLAALSSRTRARVRQSIRAYEACGPLTIDVARTCAEANEWLDRLAALHTRRWQARGDAGAFASPLFMQFHRRLIAAGVETGLVHLVRISAGERIVGFLHNFVYRGRVYFYQCGYEYGDDRRLQPGLVALSAAVRHYAASGEHEFDFLAGDAEYKKSLGQSARELEWTTIERGTLKTRAIAVLRELKRRARPA
jgi:CelD/BcsL family acetyltransferase involved in cellulose biosynthesis